MAGLMSVVPGETFVNPRVLVVSHVESNGNLKIHRHAVTELELALVYQAVYQAEFAQRGLEATVEVAQATAHELARAAKNQVVWL